MYLYEDGRGHKRSKIAILCEQQNHRCCYCGVRFADAPRGCNDPDAASIEHVIRLCDRGPRSWDNEVAACRRCNSSRGDLPAEVFYVVREQVLFGRPYVRGKHGKHGRKNRRRVRVWQSQIAMIGPSVRLGTIGEIWPQIESRRPFLE